MRAITPDLSTLIAGAPEAKVREALTAVHAWTEMTSYGPAATAIKSLLEELLRKPESDECTGLYGRRHHWDTRGRCYNCPAESPDEEN